MTGSLEIRLLGPFETLVAGRPAGVRGSKRHALLALLALRSGRLVTVASLIDALWGERLPAAPRNALQHHVARVRAALGPESIAASSEGYALRGAAVDVLRFEQLVDEARSALRAGDAEACDDAASRALSLWRGPALHGLPETPWANAERARLEALRVDALEERFGAALLLGEHAAALSPLRAALAESPFRERLWGQLMLALYRAGRQADALEAFQDARRVLSTELGLEPGPELRRLQEQILAHDTAIVAAPTRRRSGNVPAPVTSFVDREDELAQVLQLLREHRLVSLTGPPGVGKTRLALEAMRALEPAPLDGVWVVDVARAGDGREATRLLARVLDLRGANLLAQVTARLRDAEAIVVLENCAHVVDRVRPLVGALLAQCPRVRVLATSREVLHIAGEARMAVAPLGLPDPATGGGVVAPAVELFVDRARAVRPRFALTAETAGVVAEICRRLDGMPLSIELAAARVDVLGLGELLSVVERRLALLRGRPPTDVDRVALETLLAWSYDLLHADEKTLLHQIAVHEGGVGLRALVAAGARHGLDEAMVTYLLGALVDKSIATVSFPSGEASYELLDIVRRYALERLAESGGPGLARSARAAAGS